MDLYSFQVKLNWYSTELKLANPEKDWRGVNLICGIKYGKAALPFSRISCGVLSLLSASKDSKMKILIASCAGIAVKLNRVSFKIT